jgi:hypothetical protein
LVERRDITVRVADCETGEQRDEKVTIELDVPDAPPPTPMELALQALAADPAIAPETRAALELALAPADAAPAAKFPAG